MKIFSVYLTKAYYIFTISKVYKVGDTSFI